MTENTTQNSLHDAEAIRRDWATNARWSGVARDYEPEDVVKLRGSLIEEHTLARHGAERLWNQITAGDIHSGDYVNALGALTGNQAVEQVKAGLNAIYLSGWQVAADANAAGQTYPDQSIYPANSVPQVVRRINNALMRADQIETSEGNKQVDDWFAPIVADAEAGFGGTINVYELMRSMIAAGAAGVHFEDQLGSEKKCGHLGGKVLVPTSQHIRTLNAARLAADVENVPSLVIARTDAEAATLMTSDIDERDQQFVTGERTAEGFYKITNGLEAGIARGLSYAPYADLLWMETSTPDLEAAKKFAEAIHAEYRTRCCPTTARRRSTGASTSTMPPSRVPARARSHGLQVPVHHPGRLPRAQLLDVRSGSRLRPRTDEGIRRPAGARVRC